MYIPCMYYVHFIVNTLNDSFLYDIGIVRDKFIKQYMSLHKALKIISFYLQGAIPVTVLDRTLG